MKIKTHLLIMLLLGSVMNAAATGLVAEKANALKGQSLQSVTPYAAVAGRNQEVSKSLDNYTLLSTTDDHQKILREERDFLELSLPVNGIATRLFLYKVTITENDFKVITSNGSNEPMIKSVHYRGVVENTDHVAAFSFSENESMGLIATDQGNYVIGKLAAANDLYIIYRDADLKTASAFSCETDNTLPPGYAHRNDPPATAQTTKCVKWYWETDYDIYTNKGNAANVNTYMQGVFNQVSTLYANDGISITLQTLYIWNTVDPYTGPSTSSYLTQFGNYRTSFNGDLASLIGFQGGGGIAWVNGLCNSQAKYKMAYSGIHSTYNTVPTYSWTVEVITHEQGHLLGSRHTHDCAWNGNNTPIDGCGPAAGYTTSCTAGPVPVQGTIMSYCHLVSGVGINLSLGFGVQPKNLIINNINNASCLQACSGCTPPSQPSSISGSTNICPLSITTYSIQPVATASSYQWTLPSGWSGTSTSSSINVTAGASGGTISVVAVNSCGQSVARTLNVTTGGAVPAQPSVISGSTAACPSSVITYSVNPVASASSYLWTLPSGWTGSSTSNTINATAGTSGGTISVRAVNSCGQGIARTLSVSVSSSLPTTPGSITVNGGTSKVCPGETRTYTTPAASGVTFNWTVPAGAQITQGQGSNSISVSFSSGFIASGTVSVVKSNSCGTSAARSATVVFNKPGTPGSMSGNAYGLCNTSGNIYSVPAVTGVVYHWTVPAGATITSASQNSNSVTVSFPSINLTGSVSVYASNSCGNSAKRSKTVRTTPATPASIAGSSAVCPNSGGNAYSIAPVATATSYTWTGPSGSRFTAGSTTSTGNTLTTTFTNVTVSFASVTATSKLSVRANNNCGSGSTKSMTLLPLSCREEAAEARFGLFPNPTTGNATLTVNAAVAALYHIKIIDMTGKVVNEQTAKAEEGMNTFHLELEKYSKGIYLLQVNSDDNRFTTKLELQ